MAGIEFSQIGSTSGADPCPPGYIITKDNFCDPEALADSAEIDSIQKTENVIKIEKTSQTAFPLGQKTMLPPDLEPEYGRKYGYRLHIQPTYQAWTDASSILIEIKTKNGYQDSVRLDETVGFHTFEIPPNQGDSVTVCADLGSQARKPSCETFITDNLDSSFFYP